MFPEKRKRLWFVCQGIFRLAVALDRFARKRYRRAGKIKRKPCVIQNHFYHVGAQYIRIVADRFAGGHDVGLRRFQHRIDRFLDPASGDSYQVDRSIEAFMNGGLWGRGPGEGTVKEFLPDAHADFVFAVAGEEFGLIACLLIVALFTFVVLRGYGRLFKETNLFVMLAAAGLITDFGLQAVINMASSLHLMPTKGMTLPFISYGGSSLLALALAMGMFLSLTRRRSGDGALT